MSAEFRLRERKMADRENFPQEVFTSRMHTFAAILYLHTALSWV
jgi:hypothetical protein